MLSGVTTPGDLDELFRSAIASLPPSETRAADEVIRDGSGLTGTQAIELFDAQVASRHLDLAARWLRSFGEGYYTIGSSGHEGNAAVAAALRASDPALLHYRSGAFYLVRAGQAAPVDTSAAGPAMPAGRTVAGPAMPAGRTVAGPAMPAGRTVAGQAIPAGISAAGRTEAIRDVLRGLVTSSLEPIAGGRHKVFGHPDLAVVPMTSTIASHLPRAVGVAVAIERARRTGAASAWPDDAIVACSFGDATINQAAATTALNAAGWHTQSGIDLPALFICEDNGIGISVRSPDGWVAAVLSSRPGLRYFAADGCDLAATYDTAVEAAQWVRTVRKPAILHLSMVRLMGHAGADAEIAYRTAGQIAADQARDPVVASAALLVARGVLDVAGVIARYDEIGWQVRTIAEEVIAEPKLASAAEVVAPLAPRRSGLLEASIADIASAAMSAAPSAGSAPVAGAGARAVAFGGKLPETAGPMTLAQAINAGLTDALVAWPQALVFGEDVGLKGGVYGVTKGLADRFGADRVFDTLLDETTILGLALGAGLSGALPIPEIQYLAYLHSAEDQLRGEATTMQFFSQGAYRNPMVVRVAGLAYQEGFGGHFHNDNALAVLRDVPGLVVACPARPDDAAAMLRTCLGSAEQDGTVSVFLEPIALYHTRDLYTEGDRGWLASYPAPTDWQAGHVPIGRARVDIVGGGADLTIITFGNGVRMALRAAANLALAEGIGCRVVDMRWLSPLPTADIIREAAATGRVLIVDETRRSGGVGEGVVSALVDGGFVGVARRVASIDTYIPLGPAAGHVLISEESIIEGARGLLAR
jgi:2-oxoisovalerate dehydrogenase E1 component